MRIINFSLTFLSGLLISPKYVAEMESSSPSLCMITTTATTCYPLLLA